MRVYVYSPKGGIALVRPTVGDEATFSLLSFPEKRPLGNSWRPVSVMIDREDYNAAGRKRVDADFLYSNFGTLVVTERAMLALNERLQSFGEFLPLNCTEMKLYAFNVTCVLDALDLPASTLANPNRVDPENPLLLRAAFVPSAAKDAVIFRLPHNNQTQSYFTDAFLGLVNESGLTGLGARVEWEHSITGPEKA